MKFYQLPKKEDKAMALSKINPCFRTYLVEPNRLMDHFVKVN